MSRSQAVRAYFSGQSSRDQKHSVGARAIGDRGRENRGHLDQGLKYLLGGYSAYAGAVELGGSVRPSLAQSALPYIVRGVEEKRQRIVIMLRGILGGVMLR